MIDASNLHSFYGIEKTKINRWGRGLLGREQKRGGGGGGRRVLWEIRNRERGRKGWGKGFLKWRGTMFNNKYKLKNIFILKVGLSKRK